MTEGPADQEPASDLELADLARAGDEHAILALWQRHYPAALAAARSVSRQSRDAEELASDAFSNMLAAFDAGKGPTDSVRAYLVTSVRNAAASRARRAGAGDVLTGDHLLLDRLVDETGDPVAQAAELGLVREAFGSLPKRWQEVLWRTAVDHESNIDVAARFGVSPNAVAALARRARSGLRSAYVQVHASSGTVDPGCAPFVGELALLLDGGQGHRRVAEHVGTCSRCTQRLAELRRVDQNLPSLLAPAILGLSLAHSPGSAGTVSALHAAAPAPAVPGAGGVAPLWAKAAAGLISVAGALTWAVWPGRPAQPPPPHTTTTSPIAQPGTPRPPVPRPTPPVTPVPTSRHPPRPATPMTVRLSIVGGSAAASAQVTARADGVHGWFDLRLSLPAGVRLVGFHGSWTRCTQVGQQIHCRAATSPSGSVAGTLETTWKPGSAGAVTATVTAHDESGAQGSASAQATWSA